MNSLDAFCALAISFLVVCMIVLVLDLGFFLPITSENALQECLDRGFDYADDFDRIVFSTEPLGIKCKHSIDVDLDIEKGAENA